MTRLLVRFEIVAIAILLWGVPASGLAGDKIASEPERGGHGKHKAKLKWNPPDGPGAERATSYVIYRTRASIKKGVVDCGKKWVQVGTSPGEVTEYTDERVKPGESYCYAVSAITSKGETSRSFAASAQIPSP